MSEFSKEVLRQDGKRTEAEVKLLNFLIDLEKEFQLSYGDIFGILSSLTSRYSKSLRKLERKRRNKVNDSTW